MLVGLYFLVKGALGVFGLIQSLSYVTTAQQHAQPSGVAGGSGWGVASGTFGTWWLVSAAFTAASLYAGVKILQRDEIGRGTGILLAFIGLAFSLVALPSSAAYALAMMAINGFVIWVLWTSKGQAWH